MRSDILILSLLVTLLLLVPAHAAPLPGPDDGPNPDDLPEPDPESLPGPDEVVPDPDPDHAAADPDGGRTCLDADGEWSGFHIGHTYQGDGWSLDVWVEKLTLEERLDDDAISILLEPHFEPSPGQAFSLAYESEHGSYHPAGPHHFTRLHEQVLTEPLSGSCAGFLYDTGATPSRSALIDVTGSLSRLNYTVQGQERPLRTDAVPFLWDLEVEGEYQPVSLNVPYGGSGQAREPHGTGVIVQADASDDRATGQFTLGGKGLFGGTVAGASPCPSEWADGSGRLCNGSAVRPFSVPSPAGPGTDAQLDADYVPTFLVRTD